MRAIVAALVVVVTPGFALADTHLALDRFDVSPAGDSFFGVASPSIPDDLALHTKLTVDWGHLPLVLEQVSTRREVDQIVRQQTFMTAGFALAVAKRFLFSLDVPFAIFQSGKEVAGLPDASGAHIGDIRFGARARLITLAPLFNVSVGGFFYAPFGASMTNSGAYVSDHKARGRVDLMFHGDSGRYVWALSAGVDLRRDQTFVNIHQGDMVRLAAAGGVRFFDNRLQVGPEGSAYLSLKDGARYNHNIEALLGARYSVPHGFNIGAGAGPGLTSGVGTPDFRVVGNVGYSFDLAPAPVVTAPAPTPAPAPVTPAPLPPAAPAAPEPPPPDRDNDGVIDARDACVDIPGDAAHDGCPAPQDADADGIVDADDACPSDAGVANADASKHGCPLAKVVGDQIMIFEQVQFETNKDVIKPESEALLENILKVLQSLPADKRFLVEGFTDNRGGAKRNKVLSTARAVSVVKWLSTHGVDADRFSTSGQGSSRPIAANTTEDGRRANRRVEIHIVH